MVPFPLIVSTLSFNFQVRSAPQVSEGYATITAHVAVLPLEVHAVMVADPILIAVTLPEELTVATDSLSLLHVTVVLAL